VDSGLRGKTALVTGGSSGIGRAIALALAAEGVDVAVASRDPCQEVLGEIRASGVRAVRLCKDLREEAQVVSMVNETVSAFGHLDLYVNNAAWHWHEPITRMTTDGWLNTLQINLLSCAWTCREVGAHMIVRRQGSILIVGSTAQYNPAYGEAAYHSSKAALASLMQTVAIEMAPYGIRVNMLVPGSFPTRLNPVNAERVELIKRDIPLRRLGRPEDCGPAAVLLLSDRLSPYTTGAELVIGGGIHLRPFVRLSDDNLIALNTQTGGPQ